MILQQLAIFVENKKGRLSEITRIIASFKINMRALSIAETTDWGILRIIVDNPIEALEQLKSVGLPVSINDMVAVEMADHPGSLYEVLDVLAKNDIGVKYLYAFLSAKQNNAAFVAMRIGSDNTDKAVDVLTKSGYTGIDSIS
jgi:hypothetical protein